MREGTLADCINYMHDGLIDFHLKGIRELDYVLGLSGMNKELTYMLSLKTRRNSKIKIIYYYL